MDIKQKIIENIVKSLYKIKYSTQRDFMIASRKLFNKNRIAPLPKATLISTYRQLVKNKKLKKNANLEKYLIKRSVRSKNILMIDLQ